MALPFAILSGASPTQPSQAGVTAAAAAPETPFGAFLAALGAAPQAEREKAEVGTRPETESPEGLILAQLAQATTGHDDPTEIAAIIAGDAEGANGEQSLAETKLLAPPVFAAPPGTHTPGAATADTDGDAEDIARQHPPHIGTPADSLEGHVNPPVTQNGAAQTLATAVQTPVTSQSQPSDTQQTAPSHSDVHQQQIAQIPGAPAGSTPEIAATGARDGGRERVPAQPPRDVHTQIAIDPTQAPAVVAASSVAAGTTSETPLTAPGSPHTSVQHAQQAAHSPSIPVTARPAALNASGSADGSAPQSERPAIAGSAGAAEGAAGQERPAGHSAVQSGAQSATQVPTRPSPMPAPVAMIDPAAFNADGTLETITIASGDRGTEQLATQTRANTVPQGATLPSAQIAVAVAAQARAGNTRFEIRLDPPEMGRIDVRLEMGRDGSVTAHMTVDRPETLDALNRDARHLERMLQQSGLKLEGGDIRFSLRDDGTGGDGSGHEGGQMRGETPRENTDFAEASVTHHRLISPSALVDIEV